MVGSQDVAVAVAGVEVYSTGFTFDLAVRLWLPRPEVVHGGLFPVVSSPLFGGEVAAERQLLLGLEPGRARARQRRRGGDDTRVD